MPASLTVTPTQTTLFPFLTELVVGLAVDINLILDLSHLSFLRIRGCIDHIASRLIVNLSWQLIGPQFALDHSFLPAVVIVFDKSRSHSQPRISDHSFTSLTSLAISTREARVQTTLTTSLSAHSLSDWTLSRSSVS